LDKQEASSIIIDEVHVTMSKQPHSLANYFLCFVTNHSRKCLYGNFLPH